MSKFDEDQFLKSSDESKSEKSSSSSSSEDSDSDDQQEQQLKGKKQQFESDSEEEVKRVVKTQAQKRVEKLREIVLKIKDKLKNRDFNQLYDQYEELNKELSKHKVYFDKEGIPKMYIYYIWYMEQVIKNLPTEEKKKLSSVNNKAYNTLKQKLKKNRVAYEDELQKCEQDSQIYYDSDKENAVQAQKSDDSDSEKEQIEKKDKKKRKLTDQSDDSWAQEGNNSDESSEEEVGDDQYARDMRKFRNSTDPMMRRKYWMKKSYLYPHLCEKSEEELDSEADKAKEKKEREQRKIKQKQFEDDKENEKFNIQEQKASEIDLKDRTEVEKQLREIVENKTKAKTEIKYFYYEILMKCFKYYLDDNTQLLEIIMILLPLSVDLGKTMQPTHMPRKIWASTLDALSELLRLMNDSKAMTLEIQTFNPLFKKEGDKEIEIKFEEEIEEQNYRFHSKEYMTAQLLTYLITLESESYKGFKNSEFTSEEYGVRIHDNYEFLKLCKQSQIYYEKQQDLKSAAQIAMKRLENIFYFSDDNLKALRQSAKANKQSVVDEFYENESSEKLVSELSSLVYRHDSENKQNIYKAVLFQMYNHSIHNRVQQAHDLLLITHVNELIQPSSPFYIHYMRYLAQQGLAYFRLGQYKLANQHFKEIFVQKNKPLKDIIGQNISKVSSVEDRKKCLPYHMHINIELIETTNYICGMLIDIPLILNDKKLGGNQAIVRLKSANFKTLYDQYNYNPKANKEEYRVYGKQFNGPNETNTDYIFAACKQIIKGNWEEAMEQLKFLNIWNRVNNSEEVLQLLAKGVKECSLKCYILFYKSTFESMGLNLLATQFQLPLSRIKTLISKLIIKKKITANLTGNESDNFLVFQLSTRSKQQYWATQLLEKVSFIVDQNESIMYQANNKLEEETDQNQQQDGQNKNQRYNNKYNNNRQKQQIEIGAYQRKNYNNKKTYNKNYKKPQQQQPAQ